MFNFIKRNNLSFQRKTNNKKESVETKLGAIARFHDRWRCLLLIPGMNNSICPKWGRFPPHSLDQVPTEKINPALAALVQPQSEEESNGSSTEEPQVPDPTFQADASDEFSIVENDRVSENQDEEEVFMNM